MESDTTELSSVPLEKLTNEQADTPSKRAITPAERVLGLIVGHVYKVDGDDEPDGRLFFVRNITHLDSWNSGNPPNTRNDLMVTFYHTPITEVNPFDGLRTAGNVYDLDDDGTEGPLTLNASLIDKDNCVSELPTNATWFAQDTSTVQTIDPVDEITHLIETSVESIPSP